MLPPLPERGHVPKTDDVKQVLNLPSEYVEKLLQRFGAEVVRLRHGPPVRSSFLTVWIASEL